MARTLSSVVNANRVLQSSKPVYVVEVKDGVTVLGRFTLNRATITDWDGAGNHATGSLVSIGRITHELDWRGGLSFMSEVEIVIGDTSIEDDLLAASDLNVEIWMTYDDATTGIDKSDAVMVGFGVVGSWEAKWGQIALRTADYRERRYLRTVLTKVGADNVDNLCGYGYRRDSFTTWDLTEFINRDEWVPDQSRDEFVPLCFGAPLKARGVPVSYWPGADDIDDTDAHLRGPLYVFSDLRFTYGDGTGQTWIIGTPHHYDSTTKKYHPITDDDTDIINDFRAGSFDDLGTEAEALAVCIRPNSDADNAFRLKKAINFLLRIDTKLNQSIDVGWGYGRVLFDRLDGVSFQYHAASLHNPTLPNGESFKITQTLENVELPLAGDVRLVFLEVNAEITAGALGASQTFRVRWGAPSATDETTLLSSSVTKFNNWAESLGGANKTWADAEVLNSAARPFLVGGSEGPTPIADIAQGNITFRLYNTGGSATPTVDISFYGANVIVAADVPLEDVKMAADVVRSFDGAYWEKASNETCAAWETIYATLAHVFGLDETTELADSAAWEPAAGVESHVHNRMRLDFQLQDDRTGKDLLNQMAFESGMWLVHDQDAQEKPILFTRSRGAAEAVVTTCDLRQEVIKDGSLTLRRGDVDDLYNRFRLRYCRNNFSGQYEKEQYVDENGSNLTSEDISGIGALLVDWCADSQAEYGVTRELGYDAEFVQDDEAALRLMMCIAARLVRRPLMLSCAVPAGLGLGFELGDIPSIDHPRLKNLGTKISGTGADYQHSTVTGMYALKPSGSIDAGQVQVGDWVHVTSAQLVTDGRAGFYRVKYVDELYDDIYLHGVGAFNSTYTGVTWYVLPALMVKTWSLDPMANEVELDLVEIPKAPEALYYPFA